MAVKTSWHRYGTKLRHCHPVYILVMLEQFRVILLLLWTPVSAGILALVLQLYERNKLQVGECLDFGYADVCINK